ncbi:uncharacterized protein LOC143066665 [Mytilus galloprovincialis]|uniref:uncharacterized protein LOC143066665 n=1 Tax=Mytilus galloprovincialis TaxID=29158 RepID=UPI003F7C1BAA
MKTFRRYIFLIICTVFESAVFGCPSSCLCVHPFDYTYCHDKGLATVPSGIYNTTTRLTLHNNSITTLPPNVFERFADLKRLSLNSNKITTLHPNVFQGLAALTKLQLEDNQITAVNGKMFEGLTSLSTLTLDNNPLDCTNCDLEQFKFYLQNNTQLGDTGAMCEGILIINYNFTNCNDSPSETSTVNGIRSDSSSTTKKHLIIGSAVGVVALSVFVIVSIFYFYSYQKRKRIVNRIHVGQN